jgi:CheY-like chemotaxis protein
MVDGTCLGLLSLASTRRTEFSGDDIALAEAFRDQAVIAINNARLFNEVQTRLEREAATKEILSVISRSRDNETPVFRAILDRAERLCRAQGSGLQLVNAAGTHLVQMDTKGDDNGSFPLGYEFDLGQPLFMCTAVREARVVHVHDMKETELYRAGHAGRVALVDDEGVRAFLCVPLVKDGVAFGNITLSRKEPLPFSEDEIALVESFADQAVIAIENARLLRETKARTAEVTEALAYQTATSEVLDVISRAPSDVQPVFDMIVQKAVELSGAQFCVMDRIEDGVLHFCAQSGFTDEGERRLIADYPVSLVGRQDEIAGKRVLVVDDNATNRKILQLQIGKWGAEVSAFETPHAVLEAMGQGAAFDLAILDMHMPEMDGVELAGRLRKGYPALPMILFSSLGPRDLDTEAGLFAAYLAKPLRQSQLFDTLVTLFQPAAEARAPRKRAEKPKTDPEMARRHPLRILLAEDNLVNQKLATRLLEQMGYRIDLASNGKEALESVARQTYDVVLMDVQMPEMDGLEASRRINADYPDGARPRIVAMTANAMQGDRERCLAAGMDDYIAKPIRVEHLVEALLNVPSRGRGTGAGKEQT